MTRTLVLVIAFCSAAGLALGFGLASRPRAVPTPEPAHVVRKPPAPAAGFLASSFTRHEFALGAEDLANDRETPAVAVTPRGGVLLAWAAQSGTLERTLYLARSDNGGKTFASLAAFRKVPIFRYASKSKGQEVTYSTHVLPRLVAAPDGIYLGWVEAINGGPEVAYYVARSGDGGRTFSEPIRTHGKDAGKPGFTALSVAADGSLLAAWLDGRNKKGPQPFFASLPAGSEGFEADTMVCAGPDGKGVCPCCDVAVARLSDGSNVVAFRNSDAGHRDIWLARAPRGGAFGAPAPLGRDNWKFDGCPHDGPTFAIDGDHIHLVWMSAHAGTNRVYAASSTTADMTFTPRPLSAATPGAQGHPKLAVAGPGKIVAVWDESLDAAPAAAPTSHSGHAHGPSLSGTGRAVMLAITTGDGSRFGPAEPIAPVAGAFQLNPSVAVASDGAILAAWSEIDGSGKRIVLARREPVTQDHP